MKTEDGGKMLFVEMVSPLGHRDVNYFFIKNVFPHFHDYRYMIDQELYKEIQSQYHISDDPSAVFFPPRPGGAGGRMSGHVREFKKAAYVLDYMNNNNISRVYFLSYHTLSLSWYADKFKAYTVALMNHDNLSRFSKNTLRKYILRRLNDFTHVVYSYSADRTATRRLYGSLGLKKIANIEYSIDESKTIEKREPFPSDAVCLYAPSNGNDNRKIISLLEALRGTRITVKAKVDKRTYVRHQGRYGEELFHGFLDAADLEHGMINADFIVLLYPDDYQFRTSGTLFDAITYEKPVITDNRFLYESYLEKKGLGICVDNARAVAQAVSRIDRPAYDVLVENVRSYKRSCSADKIGRDVAETIQRISGC